MRMNKFTPQVKTYLTKVLTQYEEGKLCSDEEVQFFQDLVDSGMAWQFGKEISELVNSLILSKVILPPKSGYEPAPFKLSEMLKIKKVVLN